MYILKTPQWGFSWPMQTLKQTLINIIKVLRIPTGWRQTSWLFTKAWPKVQTWYYREQLQLVARVVGLNPEPLDFKSSTLITKSHCFA